MTFQIFMKVSASSQKLTKTIPYVASIRHFLWLVFHIFISGSIQFIYLIISSIKKCRQHKPSRCLYFQSSTHYCVFRVSPFSCFHTIICHCYLGKLKGPKVLLSKIKMHAFSVYGRQPFSHCSSAILKTRLDSCLTTTISFARLFTLGIVTPVY